MDRLIQAAACRPQAGGGDHTDGPGDHGGLVGEDVTEHIFRDDHIELGGIFDDLHGTVVHQHVAQLHIGVLRSQPVHDLLPQAAGVQNIALFHGAEPFVPLPGRLEADPADALDLSFAVSQHISGNAILCLMLSKVDAADQLPDDDKVDPCVHDGLFQGAGLRQLGPDLCGTVVGVDAHSGSQPEQALFGAHGPRHIVPFGAAHGTQKHAVRFQTLL